MTDAKARKMILHSASRGCGMSYRSACNRGVQDEANKMVREGILYLQDTGREKGRFIFRVRKDDQ